MLKLAVGTLLVASGALAATSSGEQGILQPPSALQEANRFADVSLDNSADAQLANSHEQQDVDKKQQNQDKKKDKKKKDKKKNDNSDDEPAAEAWYLPPLDPKFAAGLTRDYAAPRGSPVAGAGGAGYNPFVGSAASPFYYNRASTGYPYYAYGYPSQPVAAVPGSTAGYSNVYSMYPSAFYGAAGAGGRFKQQDLEGETDAETEGEQAETRKEGFLHGHREGGRMARFAQAGLEAGAEAGEGAEAESEASAFAARHGLRSRHWSEFTERAAMEQEAAAFAFAQQQAQMQQAQMMRMSAYTPSQRANRLREMQAELQAKVAELREKLAARKQGQSTEEASEAEAEEGQEKAEAASESEAETEAEGEEKESSFRRPIMVESLSETSSSEGSSKDE